MAQLVERSLLIPEVHGLNPVIGQKCILNIYCQLYWKDEKKKKRTGLAHFYKKKCNYATIQVGINYLRDWFKITRLYFFSFSGNKLISTQKQKFGGDRQTKIVREFDGDGVNVKMEIVGSDVACSQVFKRIE